MKKSIVTTCLILLFLIIAIMLGVRIFSIIMGLFAVLSFLEMFNYKYKDKSNTIKIISILTILAIIFNDVFYKTNIIYIYIISLILLIIATTINYKKISINDIMYISGIIVFISLSYSIIISIYKLSMIRCVYIFVIAFMCDIYSYIGNKLIGKRKIKDTNRTIEGSIFGIIMASFIGAVIHYNLIGENLLVVIIISLLLSSISVVGDLFLYNIKSKLPQDKLKTKLIATFDSVILVALLYAVIISII